MEFRDMLLEDQKSSFDSMCSGLGDMKVNKAIKPHAYFNNSVAF